MREFSRPFVLPLSFEFRFIVSRALQFVPVLTAVLILFIRIGTPFLWLFVAKYVLSIFLILWISNDQAEQERFSLERMAQENSRVLRASNFGFLKVDLLCLVSASLLVGGTFAAWRGDARWLIVGIALGVFLTLGWLLKWLLYDRWLDGQLKNLTREVIFTR